MSVVSSDCSCWVITEAKATKRETKMKFERVLDQFIRWFYICGLSCYPHFHGFSFGTSKNKRLAYSIPTGVMVALTLIISASLLIDLIWYFNTFSTLTIANNIFQMLIPTITVIVFAIQLVFLSPPFGEICSLIRIAEHTSMQRINFDSIAFKRQFIRKVSVIAFAFITPYLSVLCFSSRYRFLGNMALKAIVLMIWIQAFFYIEVLDHMLKCFIRHIEKKTTDTAMTTNVETIIADNSEAVQLKFQILQFQRVHFHLWSISQKINELFGSIIFIIVLQCFVWAVFIAFIIFQTFFWDGGSGFVLRSKLKCTHRKCYI